MDKAAAMGEGMILASAYQEKVSTFRCGRGQGRGGQPELKGELLSPETRKVVQVACSQGFANREQTLC